MAPAATRPPAIQTAGYRSGATPRERIAAALPAVLIPLLLLLLLMRLGVLPPLGAPGTRSLVTMSLKGEGAERARVVHQSIRRKAGGAPRAVSHPQIVRAQASPSPVPSLNILHVSHDDLAALDFAMATKHGDRGAGSGSGAGTGSDTATADASAGGGGGEADRLFAADWYKRPTDAEMATYLDSAHVREGWGEVACRTAPRFRVEDCREIAESPGSGIARALREAAWQFQVLPPRINGRPMVGSWVRIHFDVSEGFRG